MSLPQGPELLILVLVILLLFGAKKLPELAKGLGQGMKEFKTAIRENSDDDKKSDNSSQTTSA